MGLANFSAPKEQSQSIALSPAIVANKVMECAPVIMHFIRSKMNERPVTHASVPQIRVLGFISRHPGCSLTHLSEFLGISGASASTMIERLVKSGLVVRAIDPNKRRNVILHLTASGKGEFEQARSVAINELATHMNDLSTEQLHQIESSMTLLKDIFSTVYANLDTTEAPRESHFANGGSRAQSSKRAGLK